MKVLVVDDELSMREYLDVLLSRAGHHVMTADGPSQAKRVLEAGDVDLVISDMKLGTESGLDVLLAAKESNSAPEVILITAYGTPSTAVEAMRAGAYDYICKPFDNEELKLLVAKALEKRAIIQENHRLRQTVGPGARMLLGSSPAMKAVWALVDRVAAPKATVLITGESGTGKELVARAIHWRSPRVAQPFLPVNCAAITESLLESELFGHVRGSFTGATSDRAGILVAAAEGTVFLDEIGEISPGMQVKLLRVLQERMVKPVGSAQEIPFAARILAATNKNLEAEVKAGRFREDLLYRLNVINIDIAPLRARSEDIPALANFFLARSAESLGRPGVTFAPETLQFLTRYAYPGNVRQLENIIERAVTLSESDEITPAALPPSIRGEQGEGVRSAGGEAIIPLSPGFSLERYMDEMERQYLLEALERAGGVKTRAAELLGLSFRSFRYRLAKHALTDDGS